jgi:hypothetical protein
MGLVLLDREVINALCELTVEAVSDPRIAQAGVLLQEALVVLHLVVEGGNVHRVGEAVPDRVLGLG